MYKKIIATLFLTLILETASASDLLVKEAQDLKDILSTELKTEIAKNKMSFVNFWATWCSPCIQEMPELVKFNNDLEKASMKVILVNADEDKKMVDKFLSRKKIELTHYFDTDKKMINALGFSTLPYTFIIDQNFKLIKVLRGNHSYSEFERELKKLK